MFVVLAAAVSLCATPAPTSPLKTIQTVTASPLCSILRKNIGQSLSGLLANDNILAQSAFMMHKIEVDAANQPLNITATGGAGVGSQMDDMQLNQMVAQLAQNIDRIESLLEDAHAFPSTAANDTERALLQTKQRLEEVVEEQRRALNILSSTVDSNSATDLESRCDPISGCPKNAAPVRLSAPEALTVQLVAEQKAEAQASPAVFAIIDRCRKKN